ncbi:unnamed protein product, partial [Didymodactylos carnosus]
WPTDRDTINYYYYSELYKKSIDEQVLTYEQIRDITPGYIGPCLLMELLYFEYSSGFLVDTLHSVYHGAWKRLLRLWFGEDYKKKEWSLWSKRQTIEINMKNFYYPTTTIRPPRSLTRYEKFKANESRSTLFIVYPMLKDFLPHKYYQHGHLLTTAITIGESREITNGQVLLMRYLMETFIDTFEDIYELRHVVQTVHCNLHLPKSVMDFGPTCGYSTFNFESILGKITSTVHGSRLQQMELSNNIDLFKSTSIIANSHCQQSVLSDFINELQGYTTSSSQTASSKPVNLTNTDKILFDALYQNNYIIYSKLSYSDVQYSSWSASKSKTFTDSCVLFAKNDDTLCYGIIKNVIYLKRQKQYRLQITELQNFSFDYVKIENVTYTNKNIIYGELNENDFLYIKPEQLKEKVCFYTNENECFFVRLPNLVESS